MPSFDPIMMQAAKNIHLIGVGGCGMSAIAKILSEMGYKVSGSDAKEGPNTIRLKDIGIKVFIGHDRSQVRDADIIVFSSAISKSNPEMIESESKGIPSLKRAEMLAWIMQQSNNRIAVAGTHGKTTTTAMITKVLEAARLNPTFMIGCDMDYADGNARLGGGAYMVTEADESDSSFLFFHPTAEVITNIEADNMEHFGTMEELLRTFECFANKVEKNGFIAIDGTDPNNQKLMKSIDRRFITYGLDPKMQYSAKNISYSGYNSRYILLHENKEIGAVDLSVPGWQNILNSLAAFAVCFKYGIEFSQSVHALRTFVGARRRFSTVGEQNGILIIDDYAHHPTEIKATLSATRLGWPNRRIVCIFQPHRYTRTLLLKDGFAGAFADADKVVITDIYAASETPLPGITGKTIVELLDADKAQYIAKKELIPEILLQELKEGDIVLTLGAGDIYTIGKELLARLKMK